ncbi:TolC family protein [Flavobacterium sp. MAH-1]|uniref:TolC family protein n=1 Tax=Flavobacterium agri TaxID=2743471 RepID=A0A7Y8Y443_9FLAO|nr:TolC family protein [Flavobacterium agri]NUY82132.1 TolC family protein [Flavobacterium agri]NYA72156.1 TolC family protein [Flavobacterium agri]
MSKRLPQIFVLLFFCISTAQETPKVEFLTFADCLERTMANNLALQHGLLGEQVALTQYKASYGKLLPEITATGDNRNSWGKEIDSDTNLFVDEALHTNEGTLNANFNLFAGFAVWKNIKAEKQDRQISKINVERIKNDITIDLAQRYITILYLQEIIEANKLQIKSSEKQIELAQLKFDNGSVSESEVFKIKAQKASEELTLITNQNNLTDNLISIKQLMNLAIDTEIALSKPDLEINPLTNLDQQQYDLTKTAVNRHPAFRKSQLETDRARTELSLARSLRFPVITGRMFWRTNFSSTEDMIPTHEQISGNANTAIRFFITIPIFSRFQTWAEVKTAKLEWKQAQIFSKLEENRLSKEVMKAITDTRTSIKKRDASALAFEFTQKSLGADDLKFELGKININEWSLTKMNYNKAQATLIQSRYELLFNNALIKFYLGEAFSL